MNPRIHEYDSAAHRTPPLEEMRDLLASGPLVAALVRRDVTVRYKRSVLGFLWTMLNPVAMLLVFTLAFSHAFSAHTPGYPFFVVPALLLWTFFAQTTTTIAREVSIGVDLWRRVRVPKSALVVATLLTGGINLLLAVVSLVLFTAAAGRPLGPALLTLPLTLALFGLFVLGVALALGSIAVHFPDSADLYAVLLPTLMFTAPIAYPSTIVSPALRPVLQLNPITLFVEAFRGPLYGNTAPGFAACGVMAILAVLTLAGGWILFTRSANELHHRI